MLVRCAQLWDPDRGAAKFSTYVYVSLKWKVKPEDVFLPASSFELKDLEAPFSFFLVEARDTVFNILRGLREVDRMVLLMKYWRGMSARAIGRELGWSWTKAQYMLENALSAARRVADRRNG